MIRLLVTGLLLAASGSVFAQEIFNKSSDRAYLSELAHQVGDTDYINRLSKGLMVGDTMPDMELSSLGIVVNNKTGKTKISDFKGKIIILDFWNTYCKSCIEGFPKMEKLQREFGDKIQIFLVNDSQTKELIENTMPDGFSLPDLPIIVKTPTDDESSSLLVQPSFFPSRSTGHQVWIGPDGIIKLRGASQNNYFEKIQEVLAGNEVFMLKTNGTAVIFNKAIPYSDILYNFRNHPVRSGSVITAFNNDYDPETRPYVEDVIDTVNETRRSTYINGDILAIYKRAYNKFLDSAEQNLLWGPSITSLHGKLRDKFGYHFISIGDGVDSALYCHGLASATDNRPDLAYVQARICYELILPLNTSYELWQEYMLYDLNRYIRSKHGTTLNMRKRKVFCFVLIRKSDTDRVGQPIGEKMYKTENVKVNNKDMKRYATQLMVIGDFVCDSEGLSEMFEMNNQNGNPLFFFNETGFDQRKMIDITIPDPATYTSMDDLRKALKPYDLDIKEEWRELDFLVLEKIAE